MYPPWNPQAEPVPLSVATRPLTLNPKKSSSNPRPLLFNPDEDLAELTFSSIETAPTKVLSGRALKNWTTPSKVTGENSGDDRDGKNAFKRMCTVPKYIIFKEPLKLFKRCTTCGEDVLEKDLAKKVPH